MEVKTVKTVKTRKSMEWCKDPSKRALILDQAVSPITQARNEIFINSKAQNKLQALGYALVFEIF